MKTQLNMKTALYVILFAARCAQAQECVDSNTNLTVTDINGRVLMTNAAYTCMNQGRLFFGRGCQVEGFAADIINPDILFRLGLDLKEVEAKGRDDVRKKQASDRAYQRYTQNNILGMAVEDEGAARRAKNEQAAPAIAREEMNQATVAVPTVQWSEPRQIWQSPVAVLHPVFDWRWNRSSPPQWHHPGNIGEKGISRPVVIHRGTVAAPNNSQTPPAQAPRANPQGNPGRNQHLRNVGEKGASRPVVIHRGIVATPNIRHKLPAQTTPRANLRSNAGGQRRMFSRPAPSIRR
jgi:hypothetical protein